MRLPASPSAQPEDALTASEPVEPAAGTAGPEPAAPPTPRWRRVADTVLGDAFLSIASVLIALGGAIYVGMAHAPWVDRLVSQTPMAAKDATRLAMTATSANAGAAATPDAMTAARDRMEARVHAQGPDASARTVAQTDASEETSEAGRGTPSRRHRHATRHVRHASPWASHWYSGA